MIGAMGGEQSLDRMGGLSQGDAVHVRLLHHRRPRAVGHPAVLAASSPRTRSCSSTGERGGWHWALYVARLPRRVPDRDLHVPDDLPRLPRRAGAGGARARSTATCTTPSTPTNPANGEVEDTDVGFPGPDHAIAERALPMRVAMGVLAIGAIGAGLVQIPNVDFVIDDFLRPTFADLAARMNRTPRTGCCRSGWSSARALGLAGIAIAYRVWVARPGHAPRDARARCAALYALFGQQVVLRRADRRARRAPGRARSAASRSDTFERLFVDETLDRRHDRAGARRLGAVRAAQSGFLRYYAALLVLGAEPASASTSCCRA